MDAATFITGISEAGFAIHLADGNLAVSPASRLDEEQRRWIKTHKAAIVAALRVPDRLLESGQGGHDVGPANDERLIAHVPELVLSNGKRISCDMSVPAKNLPKLRHSLRFTLKDNGGGGPLLGEQGKSEVELREMLIEKYGSRLATINGEPVPVTCRTCRHADIGLRPPAVACGVGLQADYPPGQWLADELHPCATLEP